MLAPSSCPGLVVLPLLSLPPALTVLTPHKASKVLFPNCISSYGLCFRISLDPTAQNQHCPNPLSLDATPAGCCGHQGVDGMCHGSLGCPQI